MSLGQYKQTDVIICKLWSQCVYDHKKRQKTIYELEVSFMLFRNIF